MGSASFKREGGPRSRTGCNTCRRRRVKCDEASPQCLNCKRLGLPCLRPSRRIARVANTGQVRTDSMSDALTLLHIDKYAVPFSVPDSWQDRKAFHYYCNFAAHGIAGYSNMGFWEKTVLDQYRQSSFVRHAITALSRAHLDVRARNITAGTTQQLSCESLKAYGTAMLSLRRAMSNDAIPSRPAVITASVIFHVIASMSNDTEAEGLHLRNTAAMMEDWRSTMTLGEKARSHDLRSLQRVAHLVDLRASMLEHGIDSMVPPVSSKLRSQRVLKRPQLPDSASCSSQVWSASQARELLLLLCEDPIVQLRQAYISTDSINAFLADFSGQVLHVQQGLRQWRKAVEVFEWSLARPLLDPEHATLKEIEEALGFLTCLSMYLTFTNGLAAMNPDSGLNSSPWDRNPYRILTAGKQYVMLEQRRRKMAPDSVARIDEDWSPEILHLQMCLAQQSTRSEVQSEALEILRQLRECCSSSVGSTQSLPTGS